ncbi:MAG: TIGR03085 family metal-binding protein [Propionibacteriaceae bacterium]|nr:TIGR03085 family metal-binding protein [Propionibacteriaceae bacterium]
MNFADEQRAELARLLERVGPQAPTLAGDWTTHDLAAHLWVRENDPLSLPGIALTAFAPLTGRRMDRARQRYSYAELVRRFRRPRVWTKAMRPANGAEFFLHRIDVLRADHTLEYAPPTPSDEDALWGKVRLVSLRLRRAKTAIVVERADTGATHRVGAGAEIVTILGKPSELLLFLSGRGRFAHVEFIGPARRVEQVRGLDLGL